MGKNFDCYGFLLNQKLLAFLWQRQTRQVRNSMLIKMLSLAARGQSKFINWAISCGCHRKLLLLTFATKWKGGVVRIESLELHIYLPYVLMITTPSKGPFWPEQSNFDQHWGHWTNKLEWEISQARISFADKTCWPCKEANGTSGWQCQHLHA